MSDDRTCATCDGDGYTRSGAKCSSVFLVYLIRPEDVIQFKCPQCYPDGRQEGS